MDDVAEDSALILAARHCDKEAAFALNNLDVVNSEHLIECNGDDCTQSPVRHHFANFQICNFHGSVHSFR